uniref:Uncharacterized protein n=1 Tax=Arundo donax TaxID=35708 RepID=A0A0A9EE45_ARUDO
MKYVVSHHNHIVSQSKSQSILIVLSLIADLLFDLEEIIRPPSPSINAFLLELHMSS